MELENEELKIRVKEIESGAGHCLNAAGHEHIAGDLEAVLRRLNQAHEALIADKDKEISALIADKDKEISALIAEKDLVREQFTTLLTFVATAVNRQHMLLKQSKSLSGCKWHPRRRMIRFTNREHEQKQLKPKGRCFLRISDRR